MRTRLCLALLVSVMMIADVQADSSRIVFSSDQDPSEDLDIWKMNDSGSSQVQVTDESGATFRPSISLDGEKIVYDDYVDIWMMNADETGDPVNLTGTLSPDLCTSTARCEDADAGPHLVGLNSDDFYIVFTHEICLPPGGSPCPLNKIVSNLYRATADVSEGELVDLVQLTFEEDCEDPNHYQPAWCGDDIVWSREIGTFCTASPNYFWEICTMTKTGTHKDCYLSDDDTANQYPSCDSSGTVVAFAQSDGLAAERPHEICTMDLSNSVPESTVSCSFNEQDSTNAFDDTRPVWSPSDSQIAFASNRDGDEMYDIWAMNSSGLDGTTQVTTNDATDNEPDWGPALLP